MKNDFRTRNHDLVAFPPHLLNQDRDLHFTARVNFKCAGRVRVVYLQRNVPSSLTHESLLNVSRRDEFSFPTGKWRIVHQNSHPDGGRIDVDKLERDPLLAVRQRFPDVNVVETGEPDNLAGARVLRFDLLEAGIRKKRCNSRALVPAVAMNTDN